MAENNSSAPLKTAGVSLAEHRANRIYVAGPMTGLPDLNFPAFNAAAAELRAEGWHVENPAEHGIVDGAQWSDYMHTDLQQLSTCCAIYLLPGWSKSRGATLEAHVAQALGMAVYYAPNTEVQAVEAQAAPAAEPLPLLVRDIARDLGITTLDACQALKGLGNFSVNSAVTADMARKLRECFPEATEESSAGDLAEVPDGFGSAKHWKEKAQYWAGVAHELRGQALRGEPVDGIIQPSSQAEVQAEPVANEVARLRALFEAADKGMHAEAARGDRLAAALRGMLQLDEENHQRHPGDEDVCKEVRDARSALACSPATAPQAQPADALDTERLDWILRQGDEFSCYVIQDAPGDGDYWVTGMKSSGQHKDPRAAIDAAMAAAQEGGNAAKEA